MMVNPGMVVINIHEVQDDDGLLYDIGLKWKVYEWDSGYWTLISLDGKNKVTGCQLGATFRLYNPLDIIKDRLL